MHVHKSLSNKTLPFKIVYMKTGRVFGIHCWLIVWR